VITESLADLAVGHTRSITVELPDDRHTEAQVFLVRSAPGDVQSAYYSLPEGYEFDDKVLLVIEADREVVGFIDALRRYPHTASIGVGTFLIRPEFRRLGIGRAVVQALSAAAVEQDIVQISTHVVEGWTPGRRFLAALGATFSKPAVPGGAGNRNVGPEEGTKKVIPATLAIG